MSTLSDSSYSVARVGTRESALARIQTSIVISRLSSTFPHLRFDVVSITTGGDKVVDRPIAELGGRGVFVKELEEALYENRVDLVVHSLKDLPTDLPQGLCLASVLDRTDPRDVLVSKDNLSFTALPAGARVATSSRRRAAQMKAKRPDLQFTDIRGNIPTRLNKLDRGDCDAMVLAAAGLIRLEMSDRIAEYFEPDFCMPAVGQGALAVECRADDRRTLNLLKELDDPRARAEATCERAFLDRLGGGCSVPAGALARLINDDELKVTGLVAATDGSQILQATAEGPVDQCEKLGIELAGKLIALGADQLLNIAKPVPSPISPP